MELVAIRSFTTVFRKGVHCFLTWVGSIQSNQTEPISLRFSLILSSTYLLVSFLLALAVESYMYSTSLYLCYVLFPSHPHWFDRSNYILGEERILWTSSLRTLLQQSITSFVCVPNNTTKLCHDKYKKNKLHGLSPRANYTDRATAPCRQSDCQFLRIVGATWSAWRIPTAVFSDF
jgi:hypothetical protein